MVDRDSVRVINKDLVCEYGWIRLCGNGQTVMAYRCGKAMLETHTAPLSEETYALLLPEETRSGEYTVTVSFQLKEDTRWAKRGHEVAFGQGVYRIGDTDWKQPDAPFEVVRSTHNFGVRGENFECDVLLSERRPGIIPLWWCGND